jgi:hypothetical protein
MAMTPAITFAVDLTLAGQETDGPNGSTRATAVLHPDRHRGSQDAAVASMASRGGSRSVYIPSRTAAANVYRKHGDTFTLYGEDALYIRDTYAIGFATDTNNAVLRVVSTTN